MTGFSYNYKRIYRIYRELELNLHIKPRKRLKREVPELLIVPLVKNAVWSIDFMYDQLKDGCSIRLFNVDVYNREALGIEVDFYLPSAYVILSLEQINEWSGKPLAIRCDYGLVEYVGTVITEWAKIQGLPYQQRQSIYVRRYRHVGSLS